MAGLVRAPSGQFGLVMAIQVFYLSRGRHGCVFEDAERDQVGLGRSMYGKFRLHTVGFVALWSGVECLCKACQGKLINHSLG
jgi:hypothetical protein